MEGEAVTLQLYGWMFFGLVCFVTLRSSLPGQELSDGTVVPSRFVLILALAVTGWALAVGFTGL